ncbi:MAG TPA: hypothetical protein VEF90_16025 [Xanthobacteraceae bacterium]|nr:hypothetical protein [Xanthobacteraceae bacterium]
MSVVSRFFGAIVAIAALTALTLASQPAAANPAIAQKTGKPCNTCHTAPPALNDTGKAYKETGKLPDAK